MLQYLSLFDLLSVECGHTSFLAPPTMGILFEAHDDRVDSDQDGQNASQDRLDGDQYDTSHRLGSLRNSEFFDEDKNAYYREYSHDLDEDVNHIPGPSLIWTMPNKKSKHYGKISVGWTECLDETYSSTQWPVGQWFERAHAHQQQL